MRGDLRARQKFWAAVDRTGEGDACWPWIGARTPKGYGRVRRDGRIRKAHRIAYEMDRGHPPPPERPLVLHHCDNPPCCRPSHLFSGTPADNLADARSKGRRPSRPAKFTIDEIIELRRRAATGEPIMAIARELAVPHESLFRLLEQPQSGAHTGAHMKGGMGAPRAPDGTSGA